MCHCRLVMFLLCVMVLGGVCHDLYGASQDFYASLSILPRNKQLVDKQHHILMHDTLYHSQHIPRKSLKHLRASQEGVQAGTVRKSRFYDDQVLIQQEAEPTDIDHNIETQHTDDIDDNIETRDRNDIEQSPESLEINLITNKSGLTEANDLDATESEFFSDMDEYGRDYEGEKTSTLYDTSTDTLIPLEYTNLDVEQETEGTFTSTEGAY
jgi:hypothetical protein